MLSDTCNIITCQTDTSVEMAYCNASNSRGVYCAIESPGSLGTAVTTESDREDHRVGCIFFSDDERRYIRETWLSHS